MGFSFSTIEPNQLGAVTKFDIPLNEWMGLKFGEAFESTLGTARTRMEEDRIWDDGNLVRPDVANRSFGIEGELKFDQPVSIQRARLLHERKRAELERRAYLDSASHSWASAKAVAGFGASLVGSIAHPLDLGLTFLPFIGSEKAAASVAKLGGKGWRAALERGLQRGVIPEEALARAGVPYHRLSGAVIDGVVNQAVMEIPIAIQKHRDQADYGPADSAFNILAGGAFAGAIKGLGLALERAGRLWREADPRIKDAALMDAANTILTGQNPKAGQYFGLDEAAIRSKVEPDVRARNPAPDARQTLKETGVTEDNINALLDGSKTPKQVVDEQLGINDSGPDRHVEARLLAKTSAVNSINETLGIPDRFTADELYGAGAKALERSEFEAWEALSSADDQTKAQFRQWLDATEKQRANDSSRMESKRQRSIEDFMAVQKAQHEAKIKDMIDAETRKAMDDIRRANPATPPDITQRYTFKSVPDDASLKVIEDDIADWERTTLNRATTPEERIRLETEIKSGLKELDEQGMSGEKAIDDMLPCVVNRAKS